MSNTSPQLTAVKPKRSAARLAAGALLVVAVLALWQVLFWSVVQTAETAAQPAALDARMQVQYQFLTPLGQPTSDGPHMARLNGHVGYYVRERSAATRIRYAIPFEVADPTVPLALYLATRNSIDVVRINGQVIQSLSTLPRIQGLVTSEPGYVAIPQDYVRAGANVLELDSPNPPGTSQWLSRFSIGPAEPLAQTWRWKNLLQIDIALIGLAVLAFTVLLCLVVRWPEEDRTRVRALIMLLATCFAGTALLTFAPPGFLAPVDVAFLFAALSFFIGLAALGYVLVDFGSPDTWVRRLGWGYGVAVVLVAGARLGAHLTGALGEWMRPTIQASFWFVTLVAVACVALLAIACVRDRGGRWFERSVLAFCITAFGLDRLGTLIPLHAPFNQDLALTVSWSPVVGGLLGLSMVVALARAAVEARRVVDNANDNLRQRLSAREAELRESYQRQQDVQKRALLLEERQRIVRDMHDGIGGQLIGIAMQVKARQLDSGQVEQALETSISDLRLIVDSLDTADEGFDDALSSFAHRARGQAKAGGCAFETEITLAPQSAVFGPRVTLQVLRILQEGLTNALRHGAATLITLTARVRAEGDIEIVLRDNGSGLKADQPGGLGLKNMQTRALAMGAAIGWETPEGGGTAVRLILPRPTSATEAENA